MNAKNSEAFLKLRGAALQALRLKAGFASSAAAAEHFGWSPSNYKSHEAGVRIFSDVQAEAYAKAYGVRIRQILDPDPNEVQKWRERAEKELEARRLRTAERLACARILAGYATPSAAARSAGIAFSTYQKHENGVNGLVGAAAELYAEMYGVRPEWLTSGDLPSGLGTKIDRQMAAVLKNPSAFLSLRSGIGTPDPNRIGTLKATLGPGRPGVSALSIFEYDWKDVERARGQLEGLFRRVWTLPAAFFPEQGIDHRNLFIIATEESFPGEGKERIFVCRNFQGETESGHVKFDGKLGIFHPGKRGFDLGAVIWRLPPPLRRW